MASDSLGSHNSVQVSRLMSDSCTRNATQGATEGTSRQRLKRPDLLPGTLHGMCCPGTGRRVPADKCGSTSGALPRRRIPEASGMLTIVLISPLQLVPECSNFVGRSDMTDVTFNGCAVASVGKPNV